jgi:hypothetical protein
MPEMNGTIKQYRRVSPKVMDAEQFQRIGAQMLNQNN